MAGPEHTYDPIASKGYDPSKPSGFDELFGRGPTVEARRKAIVDSFVKGGGALSKSWFGGTDGPVVDEAVDLMQSMCGNPGQEAIVAQGEDGFREWASQVIEAATSSDPFDEGGDVPDLMGNLDISGEALEATSVIWSAGAKKVQDYADQQRKENQTLNAIEEAGDIIGGPLGDLIEAGAKIFDFLF